jgi:hypothetical protein
LEDIGQLQQAVSNENTVESKIKQLEAISSMLKKYVSLHTEDDGEIDEKNVEF